MRYATRQFLLMLALTVASAVALVAATIKDDLSAMPVDVCFPDGTDVGLWRFVFDGYGCNAAVFLDGNAVLMERPAEATWSGETHAGLVVGPSVSGDFNLNVSLATGAQLRTGSAPNPWEVAWVLWHYTDNSHFYYFVPKPNGWELGKADPAYPGAQRFLATGTTPTFPIGAWHRVTIAQSGQTITVSVDGVTLTTFTDNQRPYSSGQVGLYSEDAEAYFDDLTLTTPNGKGKKRR